MNFKLDKDRKNRNIKPIVIRSIYFVEERQENENEWNYNNVNNQQDAITFSFINLFNSALHVSGDKFAHPQEQFLTVYIAFGTMNRHCCRPVPRLRWN